MISDKLTIKLLDETDIPFVLDYWMNASPSYLAGMGADYNKFPSPCDFEKMLVKQIRTPLEEAKGLATIWLINGERVGHCNVNQLEFGKRANMHLHLWNPSQRMKGYGKLLLEKSIAFFFHELELEILYCEPYVLNPAPNRILPKVGFEFVKKYRCTPGSINFEQVVNQYIIKR